MQSYNILCVVILTISFKVFAQPQKFCGDNLTHVMSQHCLSYNSPGHRVRRQIVDECCHNACTIQHLLSNYCERYNSEALEQYLEKQNEIKKEPATSNENTQQASPENYLLGIGAFSQVRQNYPPRYSPDYHEKHIHNSSQVELSYQHPHAFHDHKRRKNKVSHNKNKNSRRRAVWNNLNLPVRTAPEPKLGQIEDSQKPFYVFKRLKR